MKILNIHSSLLANSYDLSVALINNGKLVFILKD